MTAEQKFDYGIKPKRIQRQRTRGWRLPPNTVYVGHPSKWGNPYDSSNKGFDCEDYRWWLAAAENRGDLKISELRGKDLACWCPFSQFCHADVLLELANA